MTEEIQKYEDWLSPQDEKYLEMMAIIAKRADLVDKEALNKAIDHFRSVAYRNQRNAAFKNALCSKLADIDRNEFAKLLRIYDT